MFKLCSVVKFVYSVFLVKCVVLIVLCGIDWLICLLCGMVGLFVKCICIFIKFGIRVSFGNWICLLLFFKFGCLLFCIVVIWLLFILISGDLISLFEFIFIMVFVDK